MSSATLHADEDVWSEGAAPWQGIKAEFGLSRSAQFELMRTGEITSVIKGKRRLIARRSVREHLRRLHRQQQVEGRATG